MTQVERASAPDSESGPSTSRWPATLSVGDITVKIYAHAIPGLQGAVSCWTYVSSGLQKLNQPELVVTLKRRDDEDIDSWSQEPIEWFKIVAVWGRANRPIDVFHTHLLRSAHWLGSKLLATATYGGPLFLPGLPKGTLPRKRLHGIALTSVETHIAESLGWTRVIAHYGLRNRWFPYTPWIDRDRTDWVTEDMMVGTVRNRIDVKRLRGVSIRWRGVYLILEIPSELAREAWSAMTRTPRNEVFALDSSLHPEADFCATWRAGQGPGIKGYSSGTAFVKNFAFIAFASDETTNSWKPFEDGCAVCLTPGGWSALRYAFNTGTSLQFPLDDNVLFSIRYSSTPYFDNFANLSALLLEESSSENPALGHGTHVALERSNLAALPSSNEAGMKVFADYIQDVHAMLLASIAHDTEGDQGGLVLVKVELPAKNGRRLMVATNSIRADLPLLEIFDSIYAIPLPPSWVDGPVKFSVLLRIWDGKLSEDVVKEMAYFF